MSMLRMIRATPDAIPTGYPYDLTGWNPSPPPVDINGFRAGFVCNAYQVRQIE